MSNLPDRTAREQAIDPRSSYIVQAPAGSGKTSLLTQRFLALLATINQPEKIIAITFTKKAASEMRERIIHALQAALGEEPQETYLKTTYQLAKSALANDRGNNWQLLENPSRLRIQTIDSLCHFLTAKMPLLSKSIPYSQVSDDCSLHYQQAAINCLNEALANDKLKQAATDFLMHLGNHLPRAIELLQSLLPVRDQWLSLLLHFKTREAQGLEESVAVIQKNIATNVFNHINTNTLDLLNQLINYRKAFIRDEIDVISKSDFSAAKSLAQLLLTSKNEWRKRFTVREGFPSESSFKNADEKKASREIKQLIKQLLENFQTNTLLLSELALANLLPKSAYAENDWQCLECLFALLPRLVAHLNVIFSEYGVVDFTEIAQSANQALGDEVATDLDLYLDYQIEHLLIDEFQDTSINQFELLSKMVRSWEAHDHRTLFIVGDPMQSIYRFRQADVSVFLKAQQSGIEDKKLIPLTLSCNFRSNQPIIEWVNNTCSKLFPEKDDPQLGAVSYHASQTLNGNSATICGKAFNSELAQAEAIIEIINANPDKQIAILVSSRNQLNFLAPYLKQQAISIQGVDLEKLVNSLLIDNLWSLTQALIHPYEKSHLLNLLISPFCGISFDELLTLDDKGLNDYTRPITDIDNIEFSPSSRERVKFLYQTLTHYQKRCFRDPLHLTVKECFYALNGKALIGSQEKNIDTFFSLLARQKNVPLNTAELELAVSKLYSDDKNTSHVSLMTIHKSKGLEFDVVIMPNINSAGKSSNQRLFKTLEVLDENSHRHFLISPIKSSFDINNPLYDFISHIDKQKDANEKLRLLYVALTRAKEALYLFSSCADIEKPKSGSFLSLLKNHLPFELVDTETLENQHSETNFFRLNQHHYQSIQLSSPPPAYNPTVTHHYDKERLVGTFIHELIYQLTEVAIYEHQQIDLEQLKDKLKAFGIRDNDLDYALSRTQTALSNLFECEKGRWIIEPHEKARNEYQLSTYAGKFIIDRTFIDKGTRWIIDYKISEHSNDIPNAYIKQLDNYALLMSKIDKQRLGKPLPIRVALYYPLSKTFISWAPGEYNDSRIVEKSTQSL